jgi:hypothetical protein
MAIRKTMAKDRAVEAALANAKKAKDKFAPILPGCRIKKKRGHPRDQCQMLKEFGQSMDGVRDVTGADSRDVTNAKENMALMPKKVVGLGRVTKTARKANTR